MNIRNSFFFRRFCVFLLLMICAPAWAAVTFEGATQVIGTNGSPRTISIGVPSGTAAGDLLLVAITVRWYQATVTPPSGWTLVQDTGQSSGAGTCNSGTTAGIRTLSYYRVAGSSETAPTFTYSSTCNDDGFAAAGMLRFSGVDASNPVVASAEATTGNSTSHQASDVSSGAETNTMLVTLHSYGSSRSWTTSPTGMTERIDQRSYNADNVLGATLGVFTQSIAAAGATGTRTATGAGDADNGATQSILLRAPNIDLAMAMSRSGNLTPSATASYTLTVSNTGTATHSGTITVVDTLPTGLTYTGYSGTGWTCTAAPVVGPGTITCTSSGAIAGGSSANAITLNVSVAAGATPPITNSATVTGSMTESSTANNTASDTYGSGTTGSCTTTTVGSDTVITCTGDGTITLPSNVSEVRYLVVGGGGGGGGIDAGPEDGAGGGGAGGVLSGSALSVTAGATYNVTVGASGTAGTGSVNGGNGGDSTFSTVTATGGGGGAREGGHDGLDGGSGGGGSDNNNGGNGIAGQGNDGGDGNEDDGGGGGGGAGADGADGTSSTGGNGGDGVSNDITGTTTYYGGGGGGGADGGGSGGSGGQGGGGDGGQGRGAGTAGTANTGGGGGGATGSDSGSAFSGGTGGSGIVVIRYPTAGTPACVTFRDEFSTESYSRNDGTANWTGNWTETGDNGSASNGNIEINNNRLQFEGDADDNTSIHRDADLSGYSSATLSFDYSENGWDSSDTMQIRVSADGGSNWTTLVTYNGDQGAGGTFSQDISAYIASNFRLAFVLTAANDGGDEFYIDNVEIEACGSSGPDHLRIEHAGSGVTCTPTTLTVKACADASCSSLYTGGVTGTLTASGTPTVNWVDGASFSIGASGSTTESVQVTTAGTVTWGTTSVSPAPGSATSCYIGATASCSFNASLAGFLFDVPNHVSDVQQNITVSAVKQADNSLACTPAFASTSKTVSFNCGYSDPASGTLPVAVGGSNITCGSASGVSLAFNASGVATTTVRYADVGQMSLTASYSGSGGSETGLVMTGSDTFIAAPASFSVTDVTAGPIKAGNDFSATVTALNASGVAAPNFGNEITPEGVTLVSTLVSPLGGSNPALGNGVIVGATFSNGVATLNNLTWGEVGNITLDAALTSGNYLGSGLSATGSATAGPFIPDHFDVELVSASSVPMPCPTGLTCPSNLLGERGFAYSGQPFSVQVTARNAAGSTTVNYDGALGFSKATTLTAWDALGSIVTQNPGGGAVGDGSIAAATFASGVAVTATPTYTFGTVPTAPTDIYVRATDTDSVSSRRASSPGSSVEPGLKVVSGRVRIANAHGSELLPLPLPVTVQYYNGTYWTTSGTDATALLAGNASIANCQKNLGDPAPACKTIVAVGSVTLANGVGSVRLNAPGTGNNGSADLTLNAAGWPAWLPGNTARATFGVFKGSNEFIYLRENY